MNNLKEVHVAVAVIAFQEQFLLGYRHANQHQGDRYEFIGGKVERNESPRQALDREVKEEIGLTFTTKNQIGLMGNIQHDYKDVIDENTINIKRVFLHVYSVELTQGQYEEFLNKHQGCEGQQLTWVTKDNLINNHYQLPEANQKILQWLS